jgi:DNA-binding NarL/FixJ family response regulator
VTIEILLVDDHAILCEGLRVLLENQVDFKVVGTAANGREALRLALVLHPQVAVMDIAMPGLDGIQATRQIRTGCPATQVVILSMHATTEYIYQARKAGASGYLLKESAGSEVIQAVRAVNAGLIYLSQKIRENQAGFNLEAERSPIERLSVREREVLKLTVDGKTSSEAGAALYLSPKTVETYRSRVLQKLGIRDHTSLVKFAIQHGLTGFED